MDGDAACSAASCRRRWIDMRWCRNSGTIHLRTWGRRSRDCHRTFRDRTPTSNLVSFVSFVVYAFDNIRTVTRRRAAVVAVVILLLPALEVRAQVVSPQDHFGFRMGADRQLASA